MPGSDQSSLSLQVQQLTERVAVLETKVEQHSELFDIQRDIFAAIAVVIEDMKTSPQLPAEDWRQRGEALLEQDKKEKEVEERLKELAEMKSKLLDLILDANLGRRKEPDPPSSDAGQ